MQRDLWTLQLLQLLARGNDLSGEQRSIIYEGIGLLAGGILERAGDRGLVTGAQSATDDVKSDEESFELDKISFDQRVRALFAHTRYEDGFRRIGSAGTNAATLADRQTVEKLKGLAVRIINPGGVEAALPVCDCSRESDWCDSITNPDLRCSPFNCTRVPDECGTFWTYDCNGMCWF